MKSGRTMVLGLATVAVMVVAGWTVSSEPEIRTGQVGAGAAVGDETALAGASLSVREPGVVATAKRGWYLAPVGTRLTYECRLVLTTDLRLRNTTPTAGRYELAGRCLLTVVRRQGDRIVTRLVLPGAALTATGGDADAAAVTDVVEDLAVGVWIDMHDDGTVVGIAFADGVDPASHNWLRTVVDALQIGTRAGVGSWQVDEVGNNGAAQVTYAWESGPDGRKPMRITKQRTRTVALVGADAGSAAPGETALWQGQSQAVFDGDLGWLASVALQERCAGAVQDTGFGFDLAIDVGMACVSSDLVADFPRDVPVAWLSLDGTATSRDRAARGAALALDRELAGRTPAHLVADLAAAIAAGDEGARFRHFDVLIRALRDRPEWVTEIADWIRRAGADAAVLEALAIALATAGTDAAQQALASWLGDDGAAPIVRMSAVRAVFALQQPLPEIAARVAVLAGTAGNPELRDSSVLAMGCVAGRVAGEHAELFAAQLHDLLAGAQQRDNLRLWFEAVGNSGLREAIDWVAPFAGSTDESLLADRLIALRRVQDPRALAILVEASQASSARVRARALEVLADRPDEARATLLAAVTSEADGEALRAALRGVAALNADMEVRATLQRLLQHADPEIRAVAVDLLARR